MVEKVAKITKGKGLGMGLSALIQASNENVRVKDFGKNTEEKGEVSEPFALPLQSLLPGKFQPRNVFNQEELEELAESIKKNGVVQPVIVRKVGDKKAKEASYEIIAGERRWRAAKITGLEQIPAIIMDIDDKQALEIALVENIQRQNLTAVEVAEGYKRLIDEFSYTQEELSEVIGKSREQITNYIRILSLPEDVKSMINRSQISFGHAKALLSSSEPALVAKRIVKQSLNVRQTEKLVQRLAEIPRKQLRQRDPDIVEMEKALSLKLGLDVNIVNNGLKGRVVISYGTLEQLDNILKRLER